MHNTNENPRIYYRVYGDNGNANHDVVKNIDEAMSLFVKVVKTSKTRRIHLDREEYIGNRCLIYNLATCQTVHELKKSAGKGVEYITVNNHGMPIKVYATDCIRG